MFEYIGNKSHKMADIRRRRVCIRHLPFRLICRFYSKLDSKIKLQYVERY